VDLESRAKKAAQQVMYHVHNSTLTEAQVEVTILDHLRVVDAIAATENVLYPPAPFEVKNQDDYYSGCGAYRNAIRLHIYAAEALRGEDKRRG
jgi:hypothetical protein